MLRIFDNSLGERENWQALGYFRSSGDPARERTCHLCKQTKSCLVWGYSLPDLAQTACAECLNKRSAANKEVERADTAREELEAKKARRAREATERMYIKLFSGR